MSSAQSSDTPPKPERRRAQRRRVIKGARLIFGFAGSSIDCRVIDESDLGLLVDTENVTQVPHLLAIRLDNGALFHVVKRWAIGTKIGLEIAGPQIIDNATHVRMQSVLDVLETHGVDAALEILAKEKCFEIGRVRRAAEDVQIAVATLKAVLAGAGGAERLEGS
jgi:hypothetical protein